MRVGYVKVYRKLLDNPRMNDPHFRAVWLQLLLDAQFEPKNALLGGETITLQPGQLTTGRKQISKNTGVNEYKVERILTCFESEHQITQQKTNTNRLITITNWKTYQDDAQQDAQQMHNDCTTDAQQLHTSEERKNVRKKEYTRPPISPKGDDAEYSETFQKFIEAYPPHRRKDKGRAYKAWKKISDPLNTLQLILKALSWQKNCLDWTKDGGQYVPYPSTYLNNQRWLDEEQDYQSPFLRPSNLKDLYK